MSGRKKHPLFAYASREEPRLGDTVRGARKNGAKSLVVRVANGGGEIDVRQENGAIRTCCAPYFYVLVRRGPRVADGRRSCVTANGRPKKVFGYESAAVAFMTKENITDKRAYECPEGCGWHIGRRERRMVFPTLEKPCGTRGCERMDAHMPDACGPEAGAPAGASSEPPSKGA